MIQIGGKEDEIILEGQTPQTKISAIQQFVHERSGIHVKSQRLFLAGEEINPAKTLRDYCIDGECSLQVKSYITVLVSSLEAPGPMMTEVEVRPRRDETVRNVKKKLSCKLGIPEEKQRLYLSAEEMTSFPRRCQLDDFSLISRYLPPSCGESILEVRHHVTKVNIDHSLTFRVPITIQDARATLETLHPTSGTEDIDENINLPHKFGMQSVAGWLNLDLDTSTIIRRDPLISDLTQLIAENLKPKLGGTSDVNSPITLKFCKNRTVHAGKVLLSSKKSSEDYHIRSQEQLLKVVIDDAEAPENSTTPMVSAPAPIFPMISYDEPGVRYTMPKDPVLMSWQVAPTEELDLGANPRIVLELSAFSYSKFCGSWDIAEHYKTYVEIMIEGTFYVGDTRKIQESLHDENFDDHSDKSAVYYAQDMLQITITGPENSLTSSPHLVNKNPMTWYRKSAGCRKNEPQLHRNTLDRRIGLPHFRHDNRTMNLPSRTKIDNNDVTYGNDGHSKLFTDSWYFGKERISEITPGDSHNRKKRFFDVKCSRGVTISGNPFLNVTFKSRNAALKNEEQRTAFDFRIQSQFYICTLEREYRQGTTLADSHCFSIAVSQNLLRTKHVPNYSDVVTTATSPRDSSMKTTMSISLANSTWCKANDDA